MHGGAKAPAVACAEREAPELPHNAMLGDGGEEEQLVACSGNIVAGKLACRGAPMYTQMSCSECSRQRENLEDWDESAQYFNNYSRSGVLRSYGLQRLTVPHKPQLLLATDDDELSLLSPQIARNDTACGQRAPALPPPARTSPTQATSGICIEARCLISVDSPDFLSALRLALRIVVDGMMPKSLCNEITERIFGSFYDSDSLGSRTILFAYGL